MDTSKNKLERIGFDERWVPKAITNEALFIYDQILNSQDQSYVRTYNPFLKRNYGSCGERDFWEVRCRCPENMLVDPSAYDHRYLLNGSRLDTNLYQRFKVIQPFYYLHKSSYGKPMLIQREPNS